MCPEYGQICTVYLLLRHSPKVRFRIRYTLVTVYIDRILVLGHRMSQAYRAHGTTTPERQGHWLSVRLSVCVCAPAHAGQACAAQQCYLA
jgi:hypothetical protein